MLPPPASPRRQMNVSIRFSSPDYDRFKHIADYRKMTVTALLHYVLVNSVLPRLEREMQSEQRQAQPRVPTTAPSATQDKTGEEEAFWDNLTFTTVPDGEVSQP